MDKNKILNIVNDVENKSNKDLLDAENFLFDEYEKTKQLAIELTKHMEAIESVHGKIVEEIEKRKAL
jgi:hypothetical protein